MAEYIATIFMISATLLNIIRVIRSRRVRGAGHVARVGRGQVHIGFWWGQPEGKRQCGRPRHRWEDNIKMDLQEKGMECSDCRHRVMLATASPVKKSNLYTNSM